MCGWLFFQQQYVLPILRQSDGGGAAGDTAPNDNNLPPFHTLRHATP